MTVVSRVMVVAPIVFPHMLAQVRPSSPEFVVTRLCTPDVVGNPTLEWDVIGPGGGSRGGPFPETCTPTTGTISLPLTLTNDCVDARLSTRVRALVDKINTACRLRHCDSAALCWLLQTIGTFCVGH